MAAILRADAAVYVYLLWYLVWVVIVMLDTYCELYCGTW